MLAPFTIARALLAAASSPGDSGRPLDDPVLPNSDPIDAPKDSGDDREG